MIKLSMWGCKLITIMSSMLRGSFRNSSRNSVVWWLELENRREPLSISLNTWLAFAIILRPARRTRQPLRPSSTLSVISKKGVFVFSCQKLKLGCSTLCKTTLTLALRHKLAQSQLREPCLELEPAGSTANMDPLISQTTIRISKPPLIESFSTFTTNTSLSVLKQLWLSQRCSTIKSSRIFADLVLAASSKSSWK